MPGRADERVRRGGKDAPRTAGREHRRLRLQDHDLARLHLERDHAEHVAVGIADEVERHPLDEEIRARADVALVERVQQRVPGAVGRRTGALHRFLAEVRGVPAERALVDRAVGVAVERHPEVLELVDDLRRRLAHVLDRILVAEPVRALDRVIHVPEPVVLGHVGERGTDAALRRDSMRARREHLREHGDRQPGFGELQRRAHARAAGADDDRVEFADGQRHGCAPTLAASFVNSAAALPPEGEQFALEAARLAIRTAPTLTPFAAPRGGPIRALGRPGGAHAAPHSNCSVQPR
jgi:hypothetical protein